MAPVQQLLDLTDDMSVVISEPCRSSDAAAGSVSEQMYSLLEVVADRVEMHGNIGKQRENWNNLLLNSINMMTLTATTVAGLGVAVGGGAPLGLKLSSTLLFTAATGMLLVMNKIQPSQLAEEQRNAVRLFKQLESEMRSRLALRAPTQEDVEEVMERILALDRASPLPLLGAMLEKFPKKFEPASWWPKANPDKVSARRSNRQRKDEKDYLRLGNIALKANKVLAVAGPVLTGLAAVSSIFTAGSSAAAAAAAMVAVTAGSLAAAVNSLEHSGQVGMVVEIYRNCAGFFRLLEESIESCWKTAKLPQAAGNFIGGSGAEVPRDGGVSEEGDGLASVDGGEGDNDDGDGDGHDGDGRVGGGDRSDGGGDESGREMAMRMARGWRWRGLCDGVGDGSNSYFDLRDFKDQVNLRILYRFFVSEFGWSNCLLFWG
ncbi:hypothetical protein CRG98_000566 [Punica granatum]|uniref:Uncharacterized protein n=1 Tax=Punica granatum TaxID=22663 RepID=A0A2I0LEI2_PUNGR|nr:hypothetical protein CRG98_000566 [Punica granatum]